MTILLSTVRTRRVAGWLPRRPVELLAILLLVALAGTAAVELVSILALGWSAAAGAGGPLSRTVLDDLLLNPWLYLVLLGVLALEWLLPARPGQRSDSVGAREDLVWTALKLCWNAWWIPFVLAGLRLVYDRHLGFLTIGAVNEWPWLARLVLALLAGDFIYWLTHLVRHKVGLMWRFHAVHHAQDELNFFTEWRVHPVDDLFLFIVAMPLYLVDQSFVTVVAVSGLRFWHTRLYHANIRSNFGLLRYVLVTPQSHRVHHARDPRYRDTNFGLTFSLWDHLFGTQYRGYNEYPATGIEDAAFPRPRAGTRLGGFGTVLAQLAYPFRRRTGA